jgi:hypothetical protein
MLGQDSKFLKIYIFTLVKFCAQITAATDSSNLPQQQGGQVETKATLSPATISNFAVPALKGFVRSISLSKGSSLQDTLRLLTLLFDYGHQVAHLLLKLLQSNDKSWIDSRDMQRGTYMYLR